MKFLSNLFLLFFTLLTLSACDSDKAVFLAQPDGYLTVEPFQASLPIGITQQYTATLTSINNDISTKTDVTQSADWQSTNPAVASVDVNGLVTTLAAGDTEIVATQGGFRGRSSLHIDSKTIAEIILQPAQATILIGLTKQFSAIARYTDNTTQDITFDANWASSNTTVASVNNSGLVAGLSVGSVNISASFGGFSGVSNLQVIDTLVDKLVISPLNNQLNAGAQVQLNCQLILVDGSAYDVTNEMNWSSSDINIASVGNAISTVRQIQDPKGLVTAIAKGDAIVTSSVTLPSGIVSTTANINVTAAIVTSLQVLPVNASAPVGTTGTFQSLAYYSDGSVADVTRQTSWLSDDQNIVYVVTSGDATGDGIALGVGQANISGSFAGYSAVSAIEVTTAELNKIQVTPFTKTVADGSQVQYAATGIYSDGSNTDLTDEAIWSSSDTVVATVDQIGYATAQDVGTTNISALYEGKTGRATLNVTAATIVSLQVTPSIVSINAGTALQLTSIATYSDGSIQDVTLNTIWGSSDSTVASVITGAENAGLVSGHTLGAATINASVALISSSAQITVTDPILNSIQVLPIDTDIPVGTSFQYTAFALYSDNSSQDITSIAGWQSDNTAVATTNLTGLVSGESVGIAQINVTFGGVTGSTNANVTNAIIESLVLTPNGGTIPLGTNGQMTATAFYSDLSTLDVTKLATWLSSDPAVISIVTTGENAGQGQSLSMGTATISAQFEGQTGRTDFNITAATLVSILVDPANETVANGFDVQYTATGIYTDGSNADISANVSWQSSAALIATIDVSGKAQTLSEGSTQITASLEGISGTAELAVSAANIVSVHINFDHISVPAGTTGQLTATAIYSDNSTQEITSQCTWLSDMPSIVSVVASGENAGFGHALSAGGPATVSISLQDNQGSVYTDTALITVTNAVLSEIQINPPNETVVSGIDLQYEAIGVYSDGATSNITDQVLWVSDDIVLVSIDQTGYATTAETLIGVANISASLDGVSKTTPLNVISVALDRLEVTPQNSSIGVGVTQQFVATAILNNATTIDVTHLVAWTSSDASVATISNTVATKALATGISSGVTEIKASILYLGTLYEDVSDLFITPRVLDHIIVSANDTTIFIDSTTQFFAQGVYTNGTASDLTEAVTWTTSNSSVAIVSNIDGNNGTVLGTSIGVADITATFVDVAARTITDSQSIEVVALDIVDLVITPGNSIIPLGENLQYTATATLADGDTINVTTQVIWASSDDAVVAISSSGYATGVSPSTVTLSAAMAGFTDNVSLAVTDSTNVIVAISPLGPRAALGTEQAFTAVITIDGFPIEGASESVVWQSGNTSIATISNAASKKGLATTQGLGFATISFDYISAVDGATYTASTMIEVVDISGATFSLTISPLNDTININQRSQYTLTGNWDIGGGDIIVQDITNDLGTSWDTGDGSIASIKTNSGQGKKGEVKGESAGSTTVTGEFGGDSATTNITVVP